MKKIKDKRIRKGVFLALYILLEEMSLREVILKGDQEKIVKKEKVLKKIKEKLKKYTKEEIRVVYAEIKRMALEKQQEK